MAATKASLLLKCLSCSRQNNKFFGVFTRQLGDLRAAFFNRPLRTQSSFRNVVARTMCLSHSALDGSVTDGKVGILTDMDPADTDQPSSTFHNELVQAGPDTDEMVQIPTDMDIANTDPMPSTFDILDADEIAEMPKAADSHLTSSVFDNELVNKFVNCMMWDGKKSLSQKIFKMAMEEIKKEQLKKQRQSSQPEIVETDPLQIFHIAVENSKPVIGVSGMKRGGKVYQVPTPLSEKRRRFMAVKWLITAAREQQKNTNRNARMYKKLAKELIDAYNNEGTVIGKKLELHKRAESNRAFAHYRWW